MKKLFLTLALAACTGISANAANLIAFGSDFTGFDPGPGDSGQLGPDNIAVVPTVPGDGLASALIQVVKQGAQDGITVSPPSFLAGPDGLTGGDQLISPIFGNAATFFGDGIGSPGDAYFAAQFQDDQVTAGYTVGSTWAFIRIWDRNGNAGTGAMPAEQDYSGDPNVAANYPAVLANQGAFYFDYPIVQDNGNTPNADLYVNTFPAGIPAINGASQWQFLAGTPLAIPEPSTIGLLLAGLFGVRIARKRRK